MKARRPINALSWPSRRSATRRPAAWGPPRLGPGRGPRRRPKRADVSTATRARPRARVAGREVLQVTEGLLPTLRVLPFGVSRKRLEQAIRELQLPVTIARSIDEADVVMTLRNEYRSKPPTVREAEERGMPVYVLKSNTVMQMNASLTSIFSLALDPREAALRETEEAIGMVIQRSEAVRALAPERLHPPPPAPDGRAGQPRLALARPGALPPGPPLPGRGAIRLALTMSLRVDRHTGVGATAIEARTTAWPMPKRPEARRVSSSSTTGTARSAPGPRASSGPHRHRRLAFLPLQDAATSGRPEVAAAVAGRSLAEALHVVDESDGRVVAGGDALLLILDALPGGRWFRPWVALPFVPPIVAAVYRLAARNRHRIGRWLGLDASRCVVPAGRPVG